MSPESVKAVRVSPSLRWCKGRVRTRAATVALVLACVAALGVGCSSAGEAGAGSRNRMESNVDGTGPTATHTKLSGPVRTDLDPLVRRFPALGAPVRASWQSGVLGDERMPGPSSFWIDAIVTLQPETAQKLRSSDSLEAADSPRVTENLRKFLPPGPWLSGTDLDRVVSDTSMGYYSHTFMARDVDVIVLIAEGGN